MTAAGRNMYAHAAAATEAHGTPQQMRPTQPYGGLAAAWLWKISLQNGGVKITPSLPPPLMPSAAPPTPSAVLPKNVRQAAASQVYVWGNGGMVLGD